MAVRVNVKTDLKGVKAKTDRMTKAGQQALANQVHADSNMYAPMLSGDMRNQSTIAIDGKSVIWHARYARAQYYGSNGRAVFKNYTTPGTGPRWDEKAKAIHGKSWENVVKKAMK